LRRQSLDSPSGKSRRQRHGERLGFGGVEVQLGRIVEHQAAFLEAQPHRVEA
jgi:hypothetical protein